MIYAINYANVKFKKAQKLNTKTAYLWGGVDRVFEFSPENIDGNFKGKNREILKAIRGNGYWLWKPYFIDQVFSKIEEGDWIIYADSGLYYLNSVQSYLINLEQRGIYAVCMGSRNKEYVYTKRDTFVIMKMDMPQYTDTYQRGAIMALKKNDLNVQMVKEWLDYAQDKRAITDMPNTCGLDNYEGFIDHRHDQSIFSLLSKKYGIYVDDLLFDDFFKRKISKAILCYHHSVYGSISSIAFHRKIDPYWYKFIRRGSPYWQILKKMLYKIKK